MRKRILFLIGLFLISGSIAMAQNKPKKGATIPEGDNVEAQKDADKAKEKRKNNKPEKPLTEKQARRAMKKRDKDQKKNYEEHYERIQQEPVKKEMKRSQKNSKYINANKKPNKIQRLFLKKRRR